MGQGWFLTCTSYSSIQLLVATLLPLLSLDTISINFLFWVAFFRFSVACIQVNLSHLVGRRAKLLS